MIRMLTAGTQEIDEVDTANTVAFMIDWNDGTKPEAKTLYAITSEGYVLLGGPAPVDALISIGNMGHSEVMNTARTVLYKVLGMKDAAGAQIYSCLTRQLLLGNKSNDEVRMAVETMGDTIPYQLCYSGGALYLLVNSSSDLVNRFHNYSFTACVFLSG